MVESNDQTVINQSGIIDRPIVNANYDIQVLEPLIDNDSLTDHYLDSNKTDVDSDLLLIWRQLIDVVNQGHLSDDHPLLIELIKQLKLTGVLPSSSDFNSSAINQFHQWFLGMDQVGTYSDLMTLFEGKLLAAWAQSVLPVSFDQIIVFDAINSFQQYTSYCQLVMPDETITLSYFSESPIAYDAAEHSSFGILFNKNGLN